MLTKGPKEPDKSLIDAYSKSLCISILILIIIYNHIGDDHSFGNAASDLLLVATDASDKPPHCLKLWPSPNYSTSHPQN